MIIYIFIKRKINNICGNDDAISEQPQFIQKLNNSMEWSHMQLQCLPFICKYCINNIEKELLALFFY